MVSGLEKGVLEEDFSLAVTPEVLSKISEGKIPYDEIVSLIKILQRENRELKKQVFIDPLTGALNRNGFNQLAISLIANSIRHKNPLSLGYFDFNFFKYLNDSYGHDVGDDCLLSTSRVFKDGLRQEDLFARWGGDEFVVLFQGTDVIGAKNAFSRIVRESYPEKIPLTLSVGLVDLGNLLPQFSCDSRNPPREVLGKLLSRADNLMYGAKKQKGTPEYPKSVLAYPSSETGNLTFEHLIF